MSFFDNTKIVGWMMFVIGILMIIGALSTIWGGVTAEGAGNIIGYVIAGVGSLIAAVIYFLFGNGVRTGATSGKMNVVAGFVRIVGVTSVIVGLFGAIGAILSDAGVWDYIVKIILGIIVLWAAGKMTDGKNTGFDKLLWIILLVIFLVLFVTTLLGIGGGFAAIITGICSAVMYLFMLVYMFDPEVKNAML